MANPSLVELPDVPDLSIQAYSRENGLGTRNRLDTWLGEFFGNSNGAPSYADWKAQKQSEYDSAVKQAEFQNEQYYNWRESLEGQRVLAEEAGYNPNLLSGASGSASSDSRQMARPPASYDADQISNPLALFSQILPLLTGFSQIQNIKAATALTSSKAEEQIIRNKFADLLYRGNAYKALNQGSLSALNNSQELQRIFGSDANYARVPWIGSEFDIGTDFERGLQYRKGNSELDVMTGLMSLRDSQIRLNNTNNAIRQWTKENVLPLQLKLLSGQVTSIDVENDIKQFINGKKNQKYVLDYLFSGANVMSKFFAPIKF